MVDLVAKLKRGASMLALLIVSTVLVGCGSSMAIKGSKDEGLRLARLLRDQGRVEAATEVYARLDSRDALKGARCWSMPAWLLWRVRHSKHWSCMGVRVRRWAVIPAK